MSYTFFYKGAKFGVKKIFEAKVYQHLRIDKFNLNKFEAQIC